MESTISLLFEIFHYISTNNETFSLFGVTTATFGDILFLTVGISILTIPILYAFFMYFEVWTKYKKMKCQNKILFKAFSKATIR